MQLSKRQIQARYISLLPNVNFGGRVPSPVASKEISKRLEILLDFIYANINAVFNYIAIT